MSYKELHNHNKSTHENFSLFFVSVIVLIAAIFTYTAFCIHGRLFSDEFAHAPQIWHLYIGSPHIDKDITVFPTYHHIISFIVRQIGYYHDNLLKLISLLISLLTIPIFYKLFQKYHPESTGIRTLQTFFFPNIFVYYYLIYTDIIALLLIATNLYLAITKRYFLSAVFGALAITLRQDSIIWIGFSFLLICFDTSNTSTLKNTIKEATLNTLKRGIPYLIIFAFFVGFLIYNGGVAVGDKEKHNSGLVNLTNFYLFLLIGWALFIPSNIKLLPDIIKKTKSPWALMFVAVGFVIYMATLNNPHEYNNMRIDYYLHNKAAVVLTESTLIKILGFFAALWMLLSLLFMPLPESRLRWMIFVIPLAVSLHPMIEPRYYIPAYLLIQLSRPKLSDKTELITLIFYIFISAYIIYGTISGKFFI